VSAVSAVVEMVEVVRYGGCRAQMRGPGADNYLLHWPSRRNLCRTAHSTCISPNRSQFVRPKTLNRWEKGETPLPERAIAEVARVLTLPPGEAPPWSVATLSVTEPRC
jgi:hypothetical protein